jgi:hypothetical protein
VDELGRVGHALDDLLAALDGIEGRGLGDLRKLDAVALLDVEDRVVAQEGDELLLLLAGLLVIDLDGKLLPEVALMDRSISDREPTRADSEA